MSFSNHKESKEGLLGSLCYPKGPFSISRKEARNKSYKRDRRETEGRKIERGKERKKTNQEGCLEKIIKNRFFFCLTSPPKCQNKPGNYFSFWFLLFVCLFSSCLLVGLVDLLQQNPKQQPKENKKIKPKTKTKKTK